MEKFVEKSAIKPKQKKAAAPKKKTNPEEEDRVEPTQKKAAAPKKKKTKMVVPEDEDEDDDEDEKLPNLSLDEHSSLSQNAIALNLAGSTRTTRR